VIQIPFTLAGKLLKYNSPPQTMNSFALVSMNYHQLSESTKGELNLTDMHVYSSLPGLIRVDPNIHDDVPETSKY
jgi:hypothetical protein